MAASFEMEWHGEELKKRVQTTCEENVMRTAKRVKAGAKKEVHVDEGDLKESIDIRKFENKGVVGAYVEAGAPGEEYIAKFVELGTPGDVYTGGAYKGQKRKPIKPAPYLRPSLKKEKEGFVNSFKDAL